MEYALYLGCTIPLKSLHFEYALREVAKILGYSFKEMPGASCCPDPIAIQSLNVTTWLTLGARNLSIAEKMGLDIFTVCSGCYETLKTVNVLLHEDKEAFNRVNETLNKIGYQYNGTQKVTHFAEQFSSDEMLEKIREKVIRPLDDLNIAAHYGCHLIRPSKIMQFDDPERPETLDKILDALGANTFNFSTKLECCGYCARLNDEIGVDLVDEKMEELAHLEREVDALIAVCPACVNQYDRKERVLQRKETELDIPVLYLPELMAIAFGVDMNKLSMNRHAVKPDKLLEKLKI
ncbi:MAG: CoB--CoM heterodisulfide reductase subunit B [Promethearchaeota archaeon]|nr:MAG: CoB--CoM heterodisulfide reductase subunit B [Candidatus Lokiarchaeota archaeon]